MAATVNDGQFQLRIQTDSDRDQDITSAWFEMRTIGIQPSCIVYYCIDTIWLDEEDK